MTVEHDDVQARLDELEVLIPQLERALLEAEDEMERLCTLRQAQRSAACPICDAVADREEEARQARRAG